MSETRLDRAGVIDVDSFDRVAIFDLRIVAAVNEQDLPAVRERVSR